VPAHDLHGDSAAIAASLDRGERFAVVFDRHHRAVHRYLARRAGAERADDLASATFVVAFERRRTFRTESTSALPWLLGIATNLLLERRRRDAVELGLLDRLRAAPGAGALDEEPPPEAARLGEALAGLDVPQREVLLLYAWADLSYEQIAEALSVPLGTVRSRLARARAHVRSHLEAVPNAPREHR
jgi:RNA polymerase sigma-70 factor (ECF subfamily)